MGKPAEPLVHFVEQKIGGTWEEAGGEVKISCIDFASAEKFFCVDARPSLSSEGSQSIVRDRQ